MSVVPLVKIPWPLQVFFSKFLTFFRFSLIFPIFSLANRIPWLFHDFLTCGQPEYCIRISFREKCETKLSSHNGWSYSLLTEAVFKVSKSSAEEREFSTKNLYHWISKPFRVWNSLGFSSGIILIPCVQSSIGYEYVFKLAGRFRTGESWARGVEFLILRLFRQDIRNPLRVQKIMRATQDCSRVYGNNAQRPTTRVTLSSQLTTRLIITSLSRKVNVKRSHKVCVSVCTS